MVSFDPLKFICIVSNQMAEFISIQKDKCYIAQDNTFCSFSFTSYVSAHEILVRIALSSKGGSAEAKPLCRLARPFTARIHYLDILPGRLKEVSRNFNM